VSLDSAFALIEGHPPLDEQDEGKEADADPEVRFIVDCGCGGNVPSLRDSVVLGVSFPGTDPSTRSGQAVPGHEVASLTGLGRFKSIVPPLTWRAMN